MKNFIAKKTRINTKKNPPQEECTIVLSTLRTNVRLIQPLHHTMGMLG
jgi:hypothetical protein